MPRAAPCKYSGAVLTPNGLVVFVPFTVAAVGLYDPATITFVAGPKSTGPYKYRGAVLTPSPGPASPP